MILKRAAPAIPIFAFLAAGLPGAVSAQAALVPEPPSSLFSTRLGDDEVELVAQGFWELGLLSSGTLSLGPGGAANLMPLVLMQTPDLYLLLSFRERWWMEASVADEAERSSFALGFSGGEGDWVREARLGNSGIALAEFPYLSFGQAPGAFGASVSALDGESGASFGAMVRWDGVSWKTRRWFGLSETRETELDPAAFLRGRRFSLPHPNVEALELYDVVAGVPRRLAADEYAAELARGLVELVAEPRGTLYAHYLVAGAEPTLPAPPESVAGKSAFLLYQAGVDNPYEALNLYRPVSRENRAQAFLRDTVTGLTDAGYEARFTASGLLELAAAGDPDARDPGFMRPLEGAAPWIYDPPPAEGVKPAHPSDSGYLIILRETAGVDAIRLETSALAGSLSVTRDGVPSQSFDHDPATGTVTLIPPPRAGEDIVIRYAVGTQDRSDGALVLGAGARFPFEGGELALAAGGRWPLPGVGYAAEGELKPAWAGLSGSAAWSGGMAALEAKAMLRYERAGATGLYRVAGMEDSLDAVSPFTPAASSAPLDLAAVPESSLSAAFPETMATLHALGEENAALRLTLPAAGAGSGIALRYIHPAPLISYETLSFYLKAPAALSAGSLALRIGDALVLTLDDLSALPVDEWIRVDMSLDPALPTVRATRANGQTLPLATGTTSFDSAGSCGVIQLELAGFAVAADEILLVDELVLSGPRGGLQLLGSLRASLGDAEADRPSYLELEAVGQLSESSSTAASITAGFALGPSAWRLDASPAFAAGEGTLGLGYTVAVPSTGAANRLVDEFSRDAGLGRYARSLSGSLALFDGALSASAAASSAERAGGFSQAWDASLAWTGVASAKAALASAVPEPVVGGADAGEAWLNSWGYFLPRDGSAAASRSLSYGLELGGGLLGATLSHAYRASSPSATSLGIRLAVPFRLGPLTLKPGYERTSTESRLDASTDFAGDHAELGDRLARVAPLWAGLPIVELFPSSPAGDFSSAMDGPAAASYAATASLEASRSVGYGLVDLFVPSSLRLAYARELAAKGDVSTDSGTLSLKAAAAAANLFGTGGARPLAGSLAYDEYSSSAEISLRSLLAADPPLLSLRLRQAASLEWHDGRTLSVSNSFSLDQGRAATGWSDSLNLGLGAKPGRTWFGDLVKLALSPRRGAGSADAAAPAAEGSPTEDSPGAEEAAKPVSAWLEAVLATPPVLITEWSLAGSAGLDTGASAVPSMGATLRYRSRYLVPGSLSFGFTAAMGTSLRLPDSGPVWGLSWELGLEGKVSF